MEVNLRQLSDNLTLCNIKWTEDEAERSVVVFIKPKNACHDLNYWCSIENMFRCMFHENEEELQYTLKKLLSSAAYKHKDKQNYNSLKKTISAEVPEKLKQELLSELSLMYPDKLKQRIKLIQERKNAGLPPSGHG